MLACCGGIAGGLLAWAAVPVLLAAAPPNTPRLNNVHLDVSVLAFTAAVTLASALLFGLVPALRYSSAGILQQHSSPSGMVKLLRSRHLVWPMG